MPKCLNCRWLVLKGEPLAKHGAGMCERGKAYVKVSVIYERQCDMFKQAEKRVHDARVIWARKLQRKGG
jgi:hypothetical protein